MKETKTALTAVTFDMSINGGVATVKREFVFKGAKISLDIEIPIRDEMDVVSVAELHRRSVQMAIALLQGLVPAQK